MTGAGASRPRGPAGLRVFRWRNFRLFYTGQLISLVGTWMQAVAQDWLVLELTNDPVALGVVAAAQFLPVMVLGLFGGLAADALPKRLGLLCTQGSACVLALILGLLVVGGHVEVWQVMVMAFLLGIVNAFDMPIRQSFVVEMVGREDIASAVALNSAAFNAARVLGPAAAGLLIGVIGLAPLFLLNSASYLVVIAGYLLMDVRQLQPALRPHIDRSVRAVADTLVEGLRYVRATPVILLCVTLIGVVSLVALNFPVLGPLVARQVLHGGAETYGFLMAAAGVGSLVSALSLAFGGHATLGRVFLGGTLVGFAVLGVGLSTVLPLSILLMGVVGWSTVAIGATTNTIIQLTVPDDLRGRVMSVYTTVFAGTTPIGSILAGSLASRVGVTVTLVVAGLVTAGITALAAVWAIRRQHLPLWSQPVLVGIDGRRQIVTPVAVTVAFDPSLDLGFAHLRWDTLALAAVLQVSLVLWALGLRERTRQTLPMEALAFVLLATVTGAVIGGRLVHVLDFLDVYAEDPVASVDLGRGSLSLVGAVLGGLLAGGYVCRIAGGRVGAWADAAAIPLLMAIGVGKLVLVLGGGGQGAPWSGDWALAFAGEGPWRAIDPAVPAWPAQALEGLWTLLGIPVVLVTRRMASHRYDGRGLLLLLAIAWWLAGRAVIALTWRDTPVAGPFGAEALATLGALALVVGTAVVIVTIAWRAVEDPGRRSGPLSLGSGG